MKKPNVKRLVLTAMLIALEIVFTRFLSIQTPIIRISFGFLPIAIIAVLYGSVYAGIGAAIADLIGVTLFPTGAFFPGFTLTAFLTGVTYGVFLYNRSKNLVNICAAALIVTMVLQLGLDTLWVQILTGKGYIALLPARIIKSLIMAPVQVICIRMAVSERFNFMLGGRSVYEHAVD